jgi:hypothetical protein
MARNLLGIVQSPENIPALTPEELAYALLEDMQARLGQPVMGMLNRNSVAEGVMSVGSFQSIRDPRELAARINKAAREAIALLERWNLAEPADDINGRNGYMVLTEKGKTTRERTDFERIRVRGFLREELLHPLLQGRIYSYFAGDDPGTAVFEAFKTVEIEVRLPDRACRTPGWAPRFAAVAGAWPGGKPQRNADTGRSSRSLPAVLD